MTKPLSRTLASPSRNSALRDHFETPTGRPRDVDVWPVWPARTSKATPAYPDSPATSHAPDPIQEATLAYPDPTALLRPDFVPKAPPAYPNSSATSQVHNTLLTPLPEPSRGPFEPHREQVRRDGTAHLRQESSADPCARCIPSRSARESSLRTTLGTLRKEEGYPGNLHTVFMGYA